MKIPFLFSIAFGGIFICGLSELFADVLTPFALSSLHSSPLVLASSPRGFSGGRAGGGVAAPSTRGVGIAPPAPARGIRSAPGLPQSGVNVARPIQGVNTNRGEEHANHPRHSHGGVGAYIFWPPPFEEDTIDNPPCYAYDENGNCEDCVQYDSDGNCLTLAYRQT